MGNNRSWMIFFKYFCFIGAIVCIVLTVLNASSTPAATVQAIVFGVSSIVLLGAGVAILRVRSY